MLWMRDHLTLAQLLRTRVYGRLPLGSPTMLHQREIIRHSPLNQRTCAALEPEWFAARVFELNQLELDTLEELAVHMAEEDGEEEEDEDEEEAEDEEPEEDPPQAVEGEA